jgi:hypothetical protein
MGGAVREKSEESAAWRWGSVFIASPLYDTVFFIFSPLIALGLVLFLDGWSAAHSRYAILGAEQYPVPVFITIWTHAHLVAVFFRSHGDRQIFARHRAAFTVVPLGLFGLFLLSDHAIIAGLVVSVFWATYHIGMQNFGLSRIYDVRCGNDPQAGRQLDWGLHQLLNLGPFLVGASLMPSLESFRRFDAVGWVAPGEWVSAYRGLHGVLTPTILIAGGFYLVYYLYSYRELVRSGHVICPQKVTQIVVTGAVSIGAWGLMEPWMAFFTVNFFHALQYFALVWWMERGNLRRGLRLRGDGGGGGLALLAFVLLTGTYGLLSQRFGGDYEVLRWTAALAVVVALMHYWYDGFVWSVQRREV